MYFKLDFIYIVPIKHEPKHHLDMESFKAEKGNNKLKNILTINLKKISSLKTQQYLHDHSLKTVKDLNNILPICYTEDQPEGFHKHSKSYDLDYPVNKVWDTYLTIPPAESWKGNQIKFSFSFDKETENIGYLEDKYEGLKSNQLIFIEIKLLWGLIKLAVTHFVKKVDTAKKTIKLCYVEGGKSAGSQIIEFIELAHNKTRVIHNTHYKSDSEFRDKRLYPILHEQIIDQFHKNVFDYMA